MTTLDTLTHVAQFAHDLQAEINAAGMGAPPAPANVFVLRTSDQIQAFAHPLRRAILGLLIEEARTNQQFAVALGESPARLHFHVRDLWRTGLIALVETRPKGGVLEKYYAASADWFVIDEALQPARKGGRSQ